MRLYLLPFAGGSAYTAYRGLMDTMTNSSIECIPLELPGRGKRFREPLLTDIHQMADDLHSQMRKTDRLPYALFGHSMGALIAFILARKIAIKKDQLPIHLFLSSREAPSVVPMITGRHLMPRDEFMAMLQDYEGTSQEALKSSELMDIFEPILRADFQAIDTFSYEPATPLPLPITVMLGDKDIVSLEDVLPWQQETRERLNIRVFKGGHFFFQGHLREIGHLIKNGGIYQHLKVLS